MAIPIRLKVLRYHRGSVTGAQNYRVATRCGDSENLREELKRTHFETMFPLVSHFPHTCHKCEYACYGER